MASKRPERNDKRVELEQRLDEIRKEYWDRAFPGWQIQLGRVHILRRYNSQFFFKVFVSFNLVLRLLVSSLVSVPKAGRPSELPPW